MPYLSSVVISFGDVVGEDSTRYPDRTERAGSNVDGKLTVDETSPAFSGTLRLTVKRAEDEDDGFLEGKLDVEFSGELVPERTAECNFARYSGAGVVDACTLHVTGGV